MKFLLVLLILSSLAFSRTFEFEEVRYSDAFERSEEHKGIIDFTNDSVYIKYNNSSKELSYDSSILTIKEDGEVLDIDAINERRISLFLEILIILYENDTMILKDKFDISKINSQIVLIPKYDIKKYIRKLLLLRENELLKEIKLMLVNNDSITIRIGYEVR